MKCSLYYIYSFVYLFFGKLYNKNCIFGGQSYQHHQSDLEIDIILQPTAPYT